MNLRFEEEQKKERRINFFKEMIRFLIEAIVVVFIAWLIVTFALKKVSVIGSSMETTLYNGEDVIVNKASFFLLSPRRSQLIAFYPEKEEEEKEAEDRTDSDIQIRRVIGLPGEKVLIKDGRIYIDGKVIEEDYDFDSMNSGGRAINEIQLDEDEYFVLSDNRNDMDDSRNTSFTKVRKENIIGKVLIRLDPFSLPGGPEKEKQPEQKE